MKRREFLKAGGAGIGAFSLAGLIGTLPRQTLAATLDLSLTAEQVNKSLVDGATVPVWQFRAATPGPGVLGAGLVANSGDVLNITLQNTLDRAINVAIPGLLENARPCLPNSAQTYSVTLSTPGSFFMTDDVNGVLGRAMGLAAPLVVLPAGSPGQLVPGGPSFDRQYTLVMQELDDRANAAVAAAGVPDLDNYEPNYFFVNGLSYPDTTTDAETLLSTTVNERVALRFINAGLIYSSMHFHGYHVEVFSRNRNAQAVVVDKDTVLVAPGECVDLILPVTQPGRYPVHNHFLPAVTANGVYANGALLMIEAV
jgi:FtsP/CotA-like multicopper oxidase with cupredoxin domain